MEKWRHIDVLHIATVVMPRLKLKHVAVSVVNGSRFVAQWSWNEFHVCNVGVSFHAEYRVKKGCQALLNCARKKKNGIAG